MGSPIHHDPEWYPDYRELPLQTDRIDRDDWDVLIVLDACRWDYFQMLINRLDRDDVSGDDVEMVTTPAEESTPDWTTQTWDRDGWDDVTYISGNPFTTYAREVDRFGVDLDARVDNYIEAFSGIDNTAWDELLRCTRPDWMTDIALDQLPESDRLVVHYLQPHLPFIGDMHVNATSDVAIVPEYEASDNLLDNQSPLYGLFKEGEVSGSVLRSGYLENLKLVWRECRRLRREIRDRDLTAYVTADHGEVLGPNRWDHGGREDPRTRIVPWYEVSI